jgi:hypothetical protein
MLPLFPFAAPIVAAGVRFVIAGQLNLMPAACP